MIHSFLTMEVVVFHHIIGLDSLKISLLKCYCRFPSASTLWTAIRNTIYQLVERNRSLSRIPWRDQTTTGKTATPVMAAPGLDLNNMDKTEQARCTPEKPTEDFLSRASSSKTKNYYARKKPSGSAQYSCSHSSVICRYFMTWMFAL